MITWIVCATEGKARIFRCGSLDDGIRFVEDFPRPEPGAPPPEGGFVRGLGRRLEEAHTAGEFDHLILCGPHPALVPIRSGVSERLRNRVIGSIDQDLYDVNESDLVGYVSSFIIEAHRAA